MMAGTMSKKNKGPVGLRLPDNMEKPQMPEDPMVIASKLEFNSGLQIPLSNDLLQDLHEIGAGNGGTVSLSRHKTANITMARKIIPISEAEAQLKLIVSELTVMHKCDHPRIVKFYGSFHHDGSINILMEYMDLGSLDRVCKMVGGKFTEQVAAQIAVGVCEGLDYLHTKLNILHRDIKPSNILLNRAGEIKLCDLGVSGELINSLAKTFVGTSWYMAPERVSMLADYGRASESWSMGLTIMEIVIGRFPFPPDGSPKKMAAFEVLTYIMQEEPPALPKDFSPEFQDFIAASVKKKYDQRPTPTQLLEHPFAVKARKDAFDMAAWASSLK